MMYESLRQFADSWGLAFMVGIFLIAIFRALRPSARATMEDARAIPFRDEEPAQ